MVKKDKQIMCFSVSGISVCAGGDFLLLKFMQSKMERKKKKHVSK